jgi:lipoyl(octanoyl) transferase
MSIFGSLNVCHDESSRSAAANMAIDEALLETAEIPTIRFYKWDHPALSFGYFGKFIEVASHAAERDLVRRWTGGGIVLHGDDLTYSIVIPAADPAFSESPMSIYAEIHASVCRALAASGQNAELAGVAALYERRPEINSAVVDRRYNKDACFDNPVRADVLSNGRKVAGAAQRRTRRGLLQQGSIQGVDLTKNFADQFAMELCSECHDKTLDEHLIARAHEIAEQKYSATTWLQRR